MDVKELDGLTKFFAGPFNTFVYKARYLILIIMTAFGCLAFSFAIQMSPLTKQEELLPDGHPVLEIKDVLMNEFTETVNSQDTLNVVIHWGIKDLDRSEVGKWDSYYVGNLIWDEQFTMLPARNQQALLEFCESLRANETIVFE